MLRPTWIFLALSWSLTLAGTPACSRREAGRPPLPPDEGVCRGTCPKACGDNRDCPTDRGQLCCDYGRYGRACVLPEECPRFCASDAECRTAEGESCCRTNAASPEKVCAGKSLCIRDCGGDGDCAAADGETCCRALARPQCRRECPKACSEDSGCDAARGEVCCTSIRDPQGVLAARGVCYPGGQAPVPGAGRPDPGLASTAVDISRAAVSVGGVLVNAIHAGVDEVAREEQRKNAAGEGHEGRAAVLSLAGTGLGVASAVLGATKRALGPSPFGGPAAGLDVSCGRRCAKGDDCGGDLCCDDGFCAPACTTKCRANADCDTANGSFCCTSGVIVSPWWTGDASAFP